MSLATRGEADSGKLLVLKRRSSRGEWPRITIAKWRDGEVAMMVTDEAGEVTRVELNDAERVALIDALS